jgi:hypothetical protein
VLGVGAVHLFCFVSFRFVSHHLLGWVVAECGAA